MVLKTYLESTLEIIYALEISARRRPPSCAWITALGISHGASR